MDAIILKCKNGSQFRIGETSLDETSDIIHSDTMFSALTNIYGIVKDFDANSFVKFVEESKIRFSSCFYSIEHSSNPQKRVFFLPKPAINFEKSDDINLSKKIKKIKYISFGIWNEIIDSFNEKDNNFYCKVDLLSKKIIGEEFCCNDDELGCSDDLKDKKFRKEITSPKVCVHQKGKKDSFYHETNIQFNEILLEDGSTIRGDFYFLIEHSLSYNEWKQFLACIRILADEGIGGERSSGRGQFDDIQTDKDIQLKVPSSNKYYLSLSLISPANNNEFKNIHSYEIITRGGGFNRKNVRMLKEGAILLDNIKGRLVDISPANNKSILRNGINFAIPLGGTK